MKNQCALEASLNKTNFPLGVANKKTNDNNLKLKYPIDIQMFSRESDSDYFIWPKKNHCLRICPSRVMLFFTSPLPCPSFVHNEDSAQVPSSSTFSLRTTWLPFARKLKLLIVYTHIHIYIHINKDLFSKMR